MGGVRATLRASSLTALPMRRLSLPAVALFVLWAGFAAGLPASAADAPARSVSPTLERIKHRGVITFAYREEAAPFSFKDRGDTIRGYSVELCERVAAGIRKELGLAELKVEWIPVDAATRIGAVATGRADAVCGTTTVTLSRMQSVDFSVPIFVDGGSVLVPAKAKLIGLADLKGRRIAVIGGTTTERALKQALEGIGASATLVAVKDGSAGMTALTRGEVDGYAGDRVVLLGFRMAAANPSDWTFIGGDFSVEPYALALPRNDADFRLAVNRVLVTLFRSGEIDPIFRRWLGAMGQPGPLLHALFYLNTFPE
jgi:glutamate/aspartate transport system substrate-binding protein